MTYLDYFKKICTIPHGSGNTKLISDYLVSFAKENGFEYHQDASNNVIIIKEADAGMEDRTPVIIQGHMDMVAVHDADREIDMTKEGLSLATDGDFLYAKGTSLGGDDGIAVAYGMALLTDKEHSYPRLELVVTVDEEIGMLGADALDVSCLKGRTMLNIDSEEEGTFLVSCAGGARIDLTLAMKEAENPEGKAYRISISNLMGGHSGTEIDKGRANAIVLMGQILKKLSEAKLLQAIGKIEGGTADNAIANSCEAVILSKTVEPELFEIIRFEVLEKYLTVDKKAEITLTETESDGIKWYINDEAKPENFLTSIPDGVVAMSRDIEGLVETSLNHGIIKTDNGNIVLSLSVRSNIDEKKTELINSIAVTAKNFGAEMSVRGDYPGWAYKKDSALREKMVSTWERMYGETPKVEALHAGLECGLFSKKLNGLDCVSFGPNLYDIHTTKEKLSLSSAERIWNFIVQILI